MWIFCYSILSLLVLAISNDRIETHKRQKRYLLFTPATQWGVFATVSIPLQPEATVSVAWFFEANYYNVDNASYFEPLLGDITVESRKTRSSPKVSENSLGIFTRANVYRAVENMLVKHGYRGQKCLLRAICEGSHAFLTHNGIMGDLFHLILTPSSSLLEDDIEDYYYEAEYYGLEKQCDQYHYGCPSSPLDLLSIFIESIT